MPAFIIVIICSQQAMNMVFMLGSMLAISQTIPLAVIAQVILAIMQGIVICPAIIGIMPAGVQHMAIPPHMLMTGIPHAIMADIC